MVHRLWYVPGRTKGTVQCVHTRYVRIGIRFAMSIVNFRPSTYEYSYIMNTHTRYQYLVHAMLPGMYVLYQSLFQLEWRTLVHTWRCCLPMVLNSSKYTCNRFYSMSLGGSSRGTQSFLLQQYVEKQDSFHALDHEWCTYLILVVQMNYLVPGMHSVGSTSIIPMLARCATMYELPAHNAPCCKGGA